MNNWEAGNVVANLDDGTLEAYREYWGGLTVRDNADYFRRWLFAFCSVHTTWKGNVAGYEAIKDFTKWLGDEEALRHRLHKSGAGIHNNRAKWITEFSEQFWSEPQWYYRAEGEPWWALRDRIAARTKGLGLAKTSFALEMSFPLDADIACLDVHMLRLYGVDQKKVNPVTYVKCENDWVGRSRARLEPPYVARMVWWDQQQGQNDSRYWSRCLEDV